MQQSHSGNFASGMATAVIYCPVMFTPTKAQLAPSIDSSLSFSGSMLFNGRSSGDQAVSMIKIGGSVKKAQAEAEPGTERSKLFGVFLACVRPEILSKKLRAGI